MPEAAVPAPPARAGYLRGPPSVVVVAVVQAVVVAAAAAGAVLLPAPAGPGPWSEQTVFDVAAAAGFSVLGALVLRRSRGHPVGSVMLAVGGLAGLGLLARGWQGWLPAAWAGQWLWWPALALTPVAVLYFPDGRLPSARWRAVLLLLAGGAATGTAALAAAAWWYPRTLTSDSLLVLDGPAADLVTAAAAAVAVWALGALAVCASLALRLRRADGVVRRQVLCLLAGAAILLLLLVVDAVAAAADLGTLPVLTAVQALALPVALTTAGLRYGLYDLDVLLNRTVVWTVMSALVLAAYVAGVAAVAGAVAGGRGRLLGTLVVTSAVAVGFEPLRRLVQRAVDRFLFGRRGEPYAVLRDLSRHLAEALDPDEALPRLVTSVAGSLRVPWVAVEIDDRLVAAWGRPATAHERFPLRVRGRDVGCLLVGTRRAGERLTGSERRLLRDLGEQCAGAVEAWLLTADLRRSREQLVRAREEERRRLRADLHDGFGPALLGSAMHLDAVSVLLPSGGRAGREVRAVAEDLRACRAELRELVEGLRPAALDAGLEAAVRAEAVRAVGGRLELPGVLPGGARTAAGRGGGRRAPDRRRGRGQRGPALGRLRVPGGARPSHGSRARRRRRRPRPGARDGRPGRGPGARLRPGQGRRGRGVAPAAVRARRHDPPGPVPPPPGRPRAGDPTRGGRDPAPHARAHDPQVPRRAGPPGDDPCTRRRTWLTDQQDPDRRRVRVRTRRDGASPGPSCSSARTTASSTSWTGGASGSTTTAQPSPRPAGPRTAGRRPRRWTTSTGTASG